MAIARPGTMIPVFVTPWILISTVIHQKHSSESKKLRIKRCCKESRCVDTLLTEDNHLVIRETIEDTYGKDLRKLTTLVKGSRVKK